MTPFPAADEWSLSSLFFSGNFVSPKTQILQKKRKKKAGEKNKKKMGALGTCVPNFRVCLEPGVNIGR